MWRALWCEDVNALWHLCGHQVHSYDAFDAPARADDLFVFAGPELPFEESLYNFECSMLLGLRFGQQLDLRQLTDAIAFYRIHQAINRIARVDGVGAYRCVRMCFDDGNVSAQLADLGVREMVMQELARMEVARLEGEPTYRVAVGVDDSHGYACDPLTYCSVAKRMEVLRID